jgi:hypothetical protein
MDRRGALRFVTFVGGNLEDVQGTFGASVGAGYGFKSGIGRLRAPFAST